MTRVLVTGASGFIGSHLVEYCAAQGLDVYGTSRRGGHGGGSSLACDLLRPDQVRGVVRQANPDVVFHLAAQSQPARSWTDPPGTLRVNLLGTLHLLEAIRQAGLSPRIVLAGSSAEYGACAADELPLREDRPLRPATPYGLSKVLQGELASFYGRVHGFSVIQVRPFLVIGTRKAHGACSDFARGIAAVESGDEATLWVGSLEPVRDLLDVRDAVRALLTVAEKGEAGEVYNVCSGVGTTINDVLVGLLSLAETFVKPELAAERLRPWDEPALVGDNSRLRRLDWQPEVRLSTSLREILDYWRAVRRGQEPAPEAPQ